MRGVLHASNSDPARILDDDLRTLNGIPSIAATLIRRRFHYASLLSWKGLDHLFALLQDSAELEWRKVFIQEMRLMWVMLFSSLRELQDLDTDPKAWEA